MKRIIKSLVDLHPGEARITLVSFFLYFTLILSYSMVKTVRLSLFLSYLGADNLPYAYFSIAILVGIVVHFYDISLRRFDRFQVITAIYLCFAMFLFLAAMMLGNPSAILSGIFYVVMDIFPVTAVTIFWSLLSETFNPDQAKRLFGFIGVGSTMGGIAGGFLVSFLVSFTTTENVLFISAGLLCFAVFLVREIRTHLLSPGQQQGKVDPRDFISLAGGFTIMKTNRYLRSIMTMTNGMLLVSLLIDFQFNKTVETTYLTKEAQAGFIGIFLSLMQCLSLVIQLVFMPRLLLLFGVIVCLFLMPLVDSVLSIGFFFMPSFALIVILKACDTAIKLGMNQGTKEMLYLPASKDAKYKAKAFIDMFSYRATKLLVGLVILFFTKVSPLSLNHLSAVILFFLVLWLLSIKKVRAGYIEELKINFRHLHADSHATVVDLPDQPIRSFDPASIKKFLDNLPLEIPRDDKDRLFAPLFRDLSLHLSDRSILSAFEILRLREKTGFSIAFEYLDCVLPFALRRTLLPVIRRHYRSEDNRRP